MRDLEGAELSVSLAVDAFFILIVGVLVVEVAEVVVSAAVIRCLLTAVNALVSYVI